MSELDARRFEFEQAAYLLHEERRAFEYEHPEVDSGIVDQLCKIMLSSSVNHKHIVTFKEAYSMWLSL